MVTGVCSTGLNCLYTNACSLLNKLDELRQRATDYGIDIIAVSETWATEELLDAELSIDGYALFRRDRKSDRFSKGGGVALYVKESLKSHLSCKLNNSTFDDSIWCDVYVGDSVIVTGVCYRSTSSTADNDEELHSLLEKADHESGLRGSQLLVMGDFNYPEISYNRYCVDAPNDSSAQKFFDCTQDLYLYQHIDEFTRCRPNQLPSILDYIFTRDEEVIQNLAYQSPLGKSDHCCILFEYVSQPSASASSDELKFNFWRGDYDSINKELGQVDWDASFDGKSVEEMWTCFKTTLMQLCVTHVPCRGAAKSRTKNDWMSRATLKLIKKREASWKRYRNVPTSNNYEAYRLTRNKVTAAVRQDKRDFQTRLVRSFKGNPKRFFGYVRSKQVVKASVTNLCKEDGSVTTSDKEAAEALNSYFQTVFVTEEPLQDADHDPTSNFTQPVQVEFNASTVKKKLMNLKKDKSPGPDGIHPMLLHSTADMIAKPLADIFSASFEQGVIPADWRKANVSPIHKKGRKDNPNNYRPVSLTSVPCKIMESIVRDAVVEHIEKNTLISDHQHGFVQGRSCLTNLLEVLEAWTRILDEGYGFDVIYLDYRKAFDTVPHTRLLRKLSTYGIGNQVIAWVTSFLSNREMRVLVRGQASDWVSVISGVPQGSVLGPLLFLLYVNDIPDIIKSNIKMFADDTKLWRMIEKQGDSCDLQDDLKRLQEWNRKWQLKFNLDKCTVMHVGHKVATQYVMEQDDQTWSLTVVTEERDLGVLVSSDLKVSRQCAEAVRKASNVLRLIKRHFFKLDKSTFLILYKCYVRPHLEYSVQAWSPSLQKDIVCMEQVQRRATKLVEGFKRLDYGARLKELGLTTLEKRRLRGDLIETYKILTARERVKKEDFFQLRQREYDLRGHQFSLEVQRSRINIRSQFFSQRTVKHWNALPDHVVSATSVINFKNRLDSCEEWGN